jgi:hypothetical protein
VRVGENLCVSAVVATKLVAVALCSMVYFFSFRTDTVSPPQIGSAMLLLLVAAPLGYDTLQYKEMIQQSFLAYYGPIWHVLGFIGALCGWLAVYVIVYALLIVAFWRLSACSSWPSLCFAILATAPGLGLEFLSILRQGLATGFVILAFFSVAAHRPWGSAAWALLALLAHPASVVPVAYVYLGRSEIPLKARMWIAATFLVAGLAWSAVSPETFEQLQSWVAFMFSRYIAGDALIEGEWGQKLFLFWALMLLSPIALRRLLGNSVVSGGDLVSTRFVVGILCLYGLLLTISGSSARVAWYFLPFCIAPMTDRLLWLRQQCGLRVPLVYAGLLFLATAYWISLAEGHFWAGEYSHPTLLPAE